MLGYCALEILFLKKSEPGSHVAQVGVAYVRVEKLPTELYFSSAFACIIHHILYLYAYCYSICVYGVFWIRYMHGQLLESRHFYLISHFTGPEYGFFEIV